MGRDRVTLQTLADRLGVSRSTVSNAFNRPDQLSDELRTRILAAADELGYCGPDPAAQSLRRGRVGAVGLIHPMLRNSVNDAANRMFLDGVAEVCETEGLALVLIPARAPDDGRPDLLRSALVDGVVIQGWAIDPTRLRTITDRRLPVVSVDAVLPGVDRSVEIDDEGGAAAAAQHVVGLGHRRVAILSLTTDRNQGMPVAARRESGYRHVLEEAGIAADLTPTHAGGGLGLDTFNARVRSLLSTPERPTAVLAMSDELAAGVVRVALAMGLRVPQDLSVVGYDDSATAFSVDPALTTVRQDFSRKGRLAVRMVLGDRSEGPRAVLPVELVVRGSTAPPTVSDHTALPAS